MIIIVCPRQRPTQHAVGGRAFCEFKWRCCYFGPRCRLELSTTPFFRIGLFALPGCCVSFAVAFSPSTYEIDTRRVVVVVVRGLLLGRW
jgi:hypothetical protein